MPYNPRCETDSRVYVNGTRLPAANVDIHIRNEGPLDMGYYCEGEFASPFQGEDYLGEFTSTNPNDEEGFDVLHIDVRDTENEVYFPAFHGVVTGLGNASGEKTPSSIWKFRAQGPAHFLDKIPAGESFQDGDTYAKALQYIIDRLDDKLPFPVTGISQIQNAAQNEDQWLFYGRGGELYRNFGLTTDQSAQSTTDVGQSGIAFGVAEGIEEGDGAVDSIVEGIQGGLTGPDRDTDDSTVPASKGRRQFQKNKHTLKDVATWVSRITNVLIYMVPLDDGVILAFDDASQIRDYNAHYLDGNVHVLNNDALSEIQPINTLVVNGEAAQSLGSVGDFEAEVPSNTYNEVRARHVPLYRRAGNTQLHATVLTNTGANTKAEVQNEAKKRLRERLTSASGGDMTTRLVAPINPYDAITAKPTCDGTPATNTEPITYNISRVHHRIRPNDISTTKLNVGIGIEDGDIQIVGTSWREK